MTSSMIFRSSSVRWDKSGFGDVIKGTEAEWPTPADRALPNVGVRGEVLARAKDGWPILCGGPNAEGLVGEPDTWARDAVMMSVGVEAGVVVLLQLKESGLTGFDDGVYPLA